MKPTKSIAAFLALAFLISAVFGTLPTRPAQAANITGKANIVCIGDSITEGRGSAPSFTSYRYPLFKKLVDAGIDFEMVGPKQGNFITNLTFDPYKTKTFSNRHYAFFGIKASVLKNNVYNDLLPINFNTAIILLGTNDRYVKGTDAETLASAQQIANDLASIVTSLRTINPNVLVFLVGLPDNWKAPMNQQMQLKAQAISTAQSTVTYIAQPAGWVADPSKANPDTLDGVHPNAQGDDKLAQQIFNGVAPFLSTGTSTASPIASATPTPNPTSSAAPTSSGAPTPTPTKTPSPTPAKTPTPTPTKTPSPTPTATPTLAPTATPTLVPTATPTLAPTPIAVTGVALDKTAATLKVSQTLQLVGSVLPTNAPNNELHWTSSNEKVATVLLGKVTAKGPGIATITAITRDGSNKSATCKITVIQPVTSVKLNKTALNLYKGKTYKLLATVLPTNATNKKVTWKSGNKAIAAVSSTGIVKGIKKGTTYVFVYTVDGKKSAKCKVVVK